MALPAHIDQDWFNRSIRQTEDGKASVLDLIRNAITGRGERQLWQRLKDQYPEVEAAVDDVRFPDINGNIKGKTTPVVDLEGWLQILALLPGAAGKKYREQTAQIMVRIWKGDADLGLAIMLRDVDAKRSERAKNRLRVVDINKLVTGKSLDNGEQPDRVHNARYQGLYKMETSAVREEMGLDKDDSPLNYMDAGDLALHEAVQHIALKAVQSKGGLLQRRVHNAAKSMRDLFMQSVGIAPSLPDPIKVGYMDPKEARAIKAGEASNQLRLNF